MSVLRLTFDTPASVREAIADAEASYTSQIASTVDAILADGARVISLAGPTCSGKTTTALRFTEEFAKHTRKCVTLSIDDFYRDRDREVDMQTTPDYESISAIDTELFNDCVTKLLRGESAMFPRYDFTVHRRAEYYELTPSPEDIYVFEGIQAIYPEILAILGGEARSIFISVTDSARINDVPFDKNELRLLRRLLRDYIGRTSPADFTLRLWQTVRDNEERTIYPASAGCDYRISSYLAYETPIIAEYLLPIIDEVPVASDCFIAAERIAAKLRLLAPLSPGVEVIPEGSILKEFTENCNEITLSKYPYGRPHRKR